MVVIAGGEIVAVTIFKLWHPITTIENYEEIKSISLPFRVTLHEVRLHCPRRVVNAVAAIIRTPDSWFLKLAGFRLNQPGILAVVVVRSSKRFWFHSVKLKGRTELGGRKQYFFHDMHGTDNERSFKFKLVARRDIA